MANPVAALIRLWRTFKWARRLALVLLAVLAIFGIGPWVPRMNWVTDAETWVIIRAAHPLILAFILGLIFSTWLIPDAWRWWKKHFPSHARTEIAVSGPHLFQDPRYASMRHHRMKIHNRGPAPSEHVRVWLRSIKGGPRGFFRGDFPYRVAKADSQWKLAAGMDTFISIEDLHLNPQGDELFVVAQSWISSEPRLRIGMIDTKPKGRDLPVAIEADEIWELTYDVTADNADPVPFRLKLFVQDDCVVMERIS